MNSSANAIDVEVDVPELAQRLGMILAALAALVAARFLRRPGLAGLIIPLWRRLTHVARRFRAAMRPTVRRRLPVPRNPTNKDATDKVATVRLPGGRGWLVRELGYEAAGYGSQLEALLSEPAMRAALVAMPRVRRVLRPLCRMLGLSCVTALDPVREKAVRGKRMRDKPGQGKAGQAKVGRKAPDVTGWQAVAAGPRHSPVSHWVTRRAQKPGQK